MNIVELLIFSFALATDAFAVAICIGLTISKFSVKKALIVGMYFGSFQAIMPLIGYMLAMVVAGRFIDYADWIVFTLLFFLGGKMIKGSFEKDDTFQIKKMTLAVSVMLPMALATSLDAMAAGVSFALLTVNIILAVILIGIITLLFSIIGVKIGGIVGMKFKSKAELIGGIVLIILAVNNLFGFLY